MRVLGKAVLIVFAIIGMVATVQELRGQGKAPLAGAPIGHVGVVVKDLDATLKMYSDVFGLTPFVVRNDVVPGYPPQFAGNRKASLRNAQIKFGSVIVELLQSREGPTPLYDYFQTHGTSVHHLSFRVPDVVQARRALQAKGGTWTLGAQDPKMGAIVDMKEQLGFSIEVSALKR